MTRKFNIGDRVRVNCPQAPRHGEVSTVIDVRPAWNDSLKNSKYDIFRKGELVCRLDLISHRSRKVMVCYPPRFLEPIHDGWEKTSWEDCVWKPAELKSPMVRYRELMS